MNKSIKIIISILAVMVLIFIFCSPSSHAIGSIMKDGKDFLARGEDVETTIDTGALHEASNYIYNLLLGIAIIGSIIVAMVLGIQFMAASADEKAKVKEALMPFVIGCVVVFGAFTIWKTVVNIGNSAEGTIVKNNSESICKFIDNGGDLTQIDVETLKEWKTTLDESGEVAYYAMIYAEMQRRGIQ